jgi:hypothetical protein
MPQIGDKYPGVSDLRLEEYSINADSPSCFEMNLIYRGGPQLGLIETGASASEESTNLDYQGKLIKLTYGDKEQSGTVQKLVPSRYWKTKRTINYDPKYEIKTYPGKVNAPGWSIDPSAAARQWLCMNIASNSVDGGKTYDVTYEFLFKDPDWDETLIYTDPDTGRPPVDAVPVKKQIYVEIDFNGLNL